MPNVHTIKFEWDSDKAQSNLTKHGVDFADAVGVFEDEMALTIEEQKALDEKRFVTVGFDFHGRVLTVVYTYRDNIIRLISARKATKKERETYAQRKK